MVKASTMRLPPSEPVPSPPAGPTTDVGRRAEPWPGRISTLCSPPLQPTLAPPPPPGWPLDSSTTPVTSATPAPAPAPVPAPARRRWKTDERGTPAVGAKSPTVAPAGTDAAPPVATAALALGRCRPLWLALSPTSSSARPPPPTREGDDAASMARAR